MAAIRKRRLPARKSRSRKRKQRSGPRVSGEALWWLEQLIERMDEEVERARALLSDNPDRAKQCVNNAIGIKYWMVEWAPPALRADFLAGSTLYEILYDFDAAADASSAWPSSDYWPELTRDEMIKALKKSLEDIKELEDSFDYNDALLEQIQKMIRWLEAMIAAFEEAANPPAPKPSNADSRLFKLAFLSKHQPANALADWFSYLELLDRHLARVLWILQKSPLDEKEAKQELDLLVANKHLFLDWLRGRVQSDPIPPDQGADDLPRPPPMG